MWRTDRVIGWFTGNVRSSRKPPVAARLPFPSAAFVSARRPLWHDTADRAAAANR